MTESGSFWYYAKGNQQYGPVEVGVVRGMLASGELAGTDLVWTGGMAEWREARAVEGLAPAVVPPPVPSGEVPGGRQGQQGPGVEQPIPMPPPSWAGVRPPPGPGEGPQPWGPFGYQPVNYGESQQGKAVGALVCGILSLLCAPAGIGLILGIVAIALASVSTSNMARTGNYEGRSMAKAGMMIGILGIVMSGMVCGGFTVFRL
jgi:hypothetical protein